VQNGAEGILPAQTSLVAPHKPQPIAAQTFDPVNPIDDPMKEAEKRDLENLRRLKQEIDQYAISHSLDGKIKTFIDERGLVIRVLTDDLLFDSGRAVLKGAASGVLGEVADLVVSESRVPNPVRVEGNTDDRPISTAQFHSNWELSTARAAAVIQFLLGKGLNAERASIAGYADQRPIASNATPSGRSLNRRVEIVVLRRSLAAAEGAALAGAAEGSHTTTEDAHADKEPKTTVKKPDQGAAAKPAAAAEKPAAPSGDGH
jgi:chemotaxis protein MotB